MEKQDDGAADNKLVAYKLLKPIGENQEGDVIHLPEAVGEALVKEGCAEMATAEDMAGTDETDEAYAEPVLNSSKKLTKQVEKAMAQTVAEAMAQVSLKKVSTGTPVLPAEVKQPLFKSQGAYIKACIDAFRGKTVQRNKVDAYQNEIAKNWEKLGVVDKAILGLNETTNASGGYLVNPQFSPDVYTIPHNQLDLQSQCQTINAQSLTYNQRFVNESSLANGSIFGGLNMVNVAEGATFTSSLPAYSNVAFTLQKQVVFVYYTEELLEDASYPFERELEEYVAKAFVYGINTLAVQGGNGIEGFLNAPSLVTVTSSGDTAYHTTPNAVLSYADLVNMWARVYPDSQASPGGMWLLHPSLVGALSSMTYTASGTSPAWGIQYNAEQGLSGNGALTPYRIFGKPAYASWACSAPGTVGDIIYVDFNTVKLYLRPFRMEVSRDFVFNSDQIAVRFCWRGDLKTVFRNKVTGVSGSDQFSALVTRSAAGT